jgi:hypothetical protein
LSAKAAISGVESWPQFAGIANQAGGDRAPGGVPPVGAVKRSE